MGVGEVDSPSFQLPAETHLTDLTLRVRDLESQEGFYRSLLGLRVAEPRAGGIRLEPGGGGFSLELRHDPAAPPRPPGSLGLYHFALLLPDRGSLAAVLRRLLDQRWPLHGASDHGVSEALYLQDAEGNGLELYRDRPRERWPVAGRGVAMTSAALDLDDLLREAPASSPLHPETRLGHIHLHVADLAGGERFYAHTLGLAVTQRSYAGALFLAAGGYHHHIGLNTWGEPRRAPDHAAGLVRYAWALPAGSLKPLEAHLRVSNATYAAADGLLALTDPVGIELNIGEQP